MTILAPFFEDCINEQDLDEMNIEIIRNTLYKSYLQSFFNFCKQIGGETEEVMCEILAVRTLKTYLEKYQEVGDQFYEGLGAYAVATSTGYAGRRPLPWLACNVARALHF